MGIKILALLLFPLLVAGKLRAFAVSGPIVARLNQEVVKALKLPDVIERLQGANDLARYSRLIHDAGIRAE